VTGRHIRIRKAWDYGLVMLLTFILIIISRVDAERTCPAVNSHRHTRHDKTVSPVSCPAWRCESAFSDRIQMKMSAMVVSLHSFIPGLKPSYSANPSHCSLPFFFFRTDSTDSPECLPILPREHIRFFTF